MTFLGLGIDTLNNTIFIPESKALELKHKLVSLLSKNKTTLKDLQSLCGSLAFFAKALPGSRAFNRRFYNATLGIKKSHHFIRVSHDMKEDASVWLQFIQDFNGYTPFPSQVWNDNTKLDLFTDSCGSCGGGAYFNGHWSFISWPSSWDASVRRDITFLELVPIVLAIWVWSAQFTSKKLLINTDNMALVHILNTKSSKSSRVMSLVRPLVLHCLKHNIQIRCVHVPSYSNAIADAISRLQLNKFRKLAPNADMYPVPVPPALLTILELK